MLLLRGNQHLQSGASTKTATAGRFLCNLSISDPTRKNRLKPKSDLKANGLLANLHACAGAQRREERTWYRTSISVQNAWALPFALPAIHYALYKPRVSVFHHQTTAAESTDGARSTGEWTYPREFFKFHVIEIFSPRLAS